MYPSIYVYFVSYGDFTDMYSNLILYMCLYIFVRGSVLYIFYNNSAVSFTTCSKLHYRIFLANSCFVLDVYIFVLRVLRQCML